MQRPTRCNAGIAAPHFSQDESLYAAAQRRQRHVELAPCHLCSRVHRSDKELEKCQKVHDVDQRRAKRSREEAEKAERRDAEKAEAAARRDAEKSRREFLRAARHCDSCGGSHSSEQQRLRCSRQRPARPLQPMPSQV